MTPEQATVLVVDDDPEMTNVLCDVLRDSGHLPISANSAVEALTLVQRERPDLLVSDLRMNGMSGRQLQIELKRVAPELPVIIITAFGSIETAVESMRLGASDYITKPFSNEDFVLVVSRALENRTLRREVKRLRGELARSYGLPNIITSDPKMLAVLDMIPQIADSTASVLIMGESGTGKDLIARALHFSGSRRDAPFVPINCAAIPANLIESELFGYIKGAFTDARQGKTGLFVTARSGTLFFDEIGEMPLPLQAKLLRAIEDKKIRPLGATEETEVDVRIIAATNSDLENSLKRGEFRPDLYYRLSTVTLTIPPLNQRRADITLLIQHFLARFSAESGRPVAEIDREAMSRLQHHPWPGNVRELSNAIERGILFCRDNRITLKDLPPHVIGDDLPPAKLLGDAVARRLTLDQLEREYLRAVLDSVDGNKTEAAAILKIDRKTLYRKLETDELDE
jgi:two-component system, NtrC family, response regulator HydG